MKFTNENEVTLTSAEYEDLLRKSKLADRIASSDPAMLEALGKYSHEAWAAWMKFQRQHDGLMCGREWYPDRWTRLEKKPYEELTREEKASDLRQAQTILDVLTEVITRPAVPKTV